MLIDTTTKSAARLPERRRTRNAGCL